MGPIWGRQDQGGPHAGPMNFAIWDCDVVHGEIEIKANGSHTLDRGRRSNYLIDKYSTGFCCALFCCGHINSPRGVT